MENDELKDGIDLDSSMVDREKVRKKAFWSRTKRQVLRHVWIVRGVILALLLSFLVLIIYGTHLLFRGSIAFTYAGLVRDFVFPSQTTLGGVGNNVNFLLMGKGGQGHDAPDLTDTMIVASINTVDKKVSLISISRDIWIDDMKAKVNSAYYYGNKKKAGGGVVLAKSTVEEVLGIPISYAATLDFDVFKDVIDILEGVSVEVQNGFVDRQFPIPEREADTCGGEMSDIAGRKTYACRYETIEFKSGVQIMDGETALKFVRSRHAVGDEGTDLAREARQQLVIGAIVRKLATPSVFLSIPKIRSLIDVANKNIETDIKPQEAATLARYVFNGRKNLKSYSIPSELLFNPPLSSKYLNTYVFVPVGGNWEKVHGWVDGIVKN